MGTEVVTCQEGDMLTAPHNIPGYESNGHCHSAAQHQKRCWASFALILSVSATVSYVYFSHVGPMLHFESNLEFHKSIVNGSALAPYRYRVLVPFFTEVVARIATLFLPTRQAFLLAYGLYHWFAIALLLTLLFIYLRQWFDYEPSLVAVLFVAATMSIALREFQPWSLLEAALLTAALLLILRGYYAALCPVTVLAALTRETAYLIPLALLVTSVDFRRPDRRVLLWVGICGSIYLGIFAGLRLWLGQAPHILTLKEIWLWNLQPPHPMEAVLHCSLFLGVSWFFALLGYKHAPPFCRKAVLIALPHILSVAIWGVWYEVRLLMPLYAVVMPLSLSFLYPQEAPDSD